MISVATLRWQLAGMSSARLRAEYLARRQHPGGLGSRLVLRAVRDELASRESAA